MKKAILIALTLTLTSCGFQAMLDKTHKTVIVLSKEVEPKLLERCRSKIRECKKKGIKQEACADDIQCRKELKTYVETAKDFHTALQRMNSSYLWLIKVGIIGE